MRTLPGATYSALLSRTDGADCDQITRGHCGSRGVRPDYTCIGDVVNRAQRHESKAHLGSLLLSRVLYHRSTARVIVEELRAVTLTDTDEPVSAHILKGFP